jgi:hypothetical protein
MLPVRSQSPKRAWLLEGRSGAPSRERTGHFRAGFGLSAPNSAAVRPRPHTPARRRVAQLSGGVYLGEQTLAVKGGHTAVLPYRDTL